MKLGVFGAVLGLSFLAVSRADSSLLHCNLVGPKSPTLRLSRHLLCEYDTSLRPVLNKNTPINVTVSISPKFMDFVDRTSTFILHAWVFIYWKDEHLTWKPEDYDGVERMKVKSSDIWVPDFSVYNSGDMELTQTGVPNTQCQLLHTGLVICVPSIKYSTQCDTDFTYWPYDTQKCSIRMGSWTHTGEEISFDFRKKSINMLDFTPNKQWLVTNYSTKKHNPKFSCCPNDTFPTLIVQFELKRHSPMIHAAFITPAVVLMIITLTVLWLDSRSIERISLAAVNFICHMLCIYDLHWLLPENGSTPPHILLFYRDSMVLATLAMITTALLRKLQAARLSAPGWIVATVTAVASNRAGRFLLLDSSPDAKLVEPERDLEDCGSVNQSEPSGGPCRPDGSSWRKFAVIVEWLSFLLAALLYFVLVITLVPMSGSTS